MPCGLRLVLGDPGGDAVQEGAEGGPVLAQLYRDRLIARNPQKVFDSINVFPLREPVTIDGCPSQQS